MTFLVLSIVFNALIFLFFKWLGKMKENTFIVVTLNYLFAALLGFTLSGDFNAGNLIKFPWFTATLVLGMIFVFVFYLMAITTREAGASKAVVANKLALIIPVISAYYLYGDHFGILKTCGLILSIAGIIMLIRKGRDLLSTRSASLVLMLFLVSGFIDSSLKYIQHQWMEMDDALLFTSTLFAFAFFSGIISFWIFKTGEGPIFSVRAVYLGLILGCINVGSIYFIVKTLQLQGMESSVVFPLNNLGVIVLSSAASILFFGERPGRINYFGLLLSVLALVVLLTSHYFQQ